MDSLQEVFLDESTSRTAGCMQATYSAGGISWMTLHAGSLDGRIQKSTRSDRSSIATDRLWAPWKVSTPPRLRGPIRRQEPRFPLTITPFIPVTSGSSSRSSKGTVVDGGGRSDGEVAL